MGEKDKKNTRQLCQLRINSKTVILVPPEKCNEAYANKVRCRLAKGGAPMSMKYLEY
ncbi:MAG: hypothetical protein IJZ44_05825 [Lachnospiraceae bacterium]|nr:hypothetical protein [Lachnospiraceae bacterium]